MVKLFGWLLLVLPMTAIGAGAGAGTAAKAEFFTQDLFVDHVSTVPANAGQKVGLFVRQKVLAMKKDRAAPVVLFVHGATVPGVPDFDLEYKDYKLDGASGACRFQHLHHGSHRLRRLAQADDG